VRRQGRAFHVRRAVCSAGVFVLFGLSLAGCSAGSSSLLGFSATKLLTDPRHALLADVRVGASPAGMAFADRGRRIVVADTDRYTTPVHVGALSIVSLPAALAGKPALLGAVAAADFPREMSLEPNGRTLLITNYGSDELEAINTLNLP